MNARTLLWIGVSFAAFVFLSIAWGIHRRVRQAQREFAKYRYEVKKVETEEKVDEIEQQIWGIG